MLLYYQHKQYLSNWQQFACFGQTIQELITNLESQREVAMNWFNKNKMAENLGKFRAAQDFFYKSAASQINANFNERKVLVNNLCL